MNVFHPADTVISSHTLTLHDITNKLDKIMRLADVISIWWHPIHSIWEISNWNHHSFLLISILSSISSAISTLCLQYFQPLLRLSLSPKYLNIILSSSVITSMRRWLIASFYTATISVPLIGRYDPFQSVLHPIDDIHSCLQSSCFFPSQTSWCTALSWRKRQQKNSEGRCWASSCLDRTVESKKSKGVKAPFPPPILDDVQ